MQSKMAGGLQHRPSARPNANMPLGPIQPPTNEWIEPYRNMHVQVKWRVVQLADVLLVCFEFLAAAHEIFQVLAIAVSNECTAFCHHSPSGPRKKAFAFEFGI